MLCIGLTGGIGSGKSAAAQRFAELGAEVIDTDIIAREIVLPGEPALSEIAAAFDDEFQTPVLHPDGSLNRAALRECIFKSPTARERLESITHPRIRETAIARMTQARAARHAEGAAAYCVLVVPLLFETGYQHLVDRVLVIDASPENQISRVVARDQSRPEQVNAIIAAQIDRNERRNRADDIIENNASLVELYVAVERLHRRYLEEQSH